MFQFLVLKKHSLILAIITVIIFHFSTNLSVCLLLKKHFANSRTKWAMSLEDFLLIREAQKITSTSRILVAQCQKWKLVFASFLVLRYLKAKQGRHPWGGEEAFPQIVQLAVCLECDAVVWSAHTYSHEILLCAPLRSGGRARWGGLFSTGPKELNKPESFLNFLSVTKTYSDHIQLDFNYQWRLI